MGLVLDPSVFVPKFQALIYVLENGGPGSDSAAGGLGAPPAPPPAPRRQQEQGAAAPRARRRQHAERAAQQEAARGCQVSVLQRHEQGAASSLTTHSHLPPRVLSLSFLAIKLTRTYGVVTRILYSDTDERT